MKSHTSITIRGLGCINENKNFSRVPSPRGQRCFISCVTSGKSLGLSGASLPPLCSGCGEGLKQRQKPGAQLEASPSPIPLPLKAPRGGKLSPEAWLWS